MWILRLFVICFIICISTVSAFADTHNVASPYGATEVNAAITAATSGDTVYIPESTVTWSSAVTLKTGITLMGAGRDSTKVTVSTQISIPAGIYNWRITGIGFTNTALANMIMCNGGTEGWRIDNCSFTYTGTPKILNLFYLAATNATNKRGYGLFDNNIVVNLRVPLFYGATCDYKYNTEWVNDPGLGTANALFMENNTITNTMGANSNTEPDANCGARVVFRYNSIDSFNGAMHSPQGTNRGARMWEFYNNAYTANAYTTWITNHLRSGTGVTYNNTIGAGYASGFGLDNVRSSETRAPFGVCDGTSVWDGNRTDQHGYPCRDQIGRSTDASQMSEGNYPTQALAPVYFWNNKRGSTEITAFVRDLASPSGDHLLKDYQIIENRDFYNADTTNCPANPAGSCTKGVGVGTLANRPTSCTHIPVATGLTSGEGGDDVGAGVAYWATDENKLYKCTATNTWTEYYTPYTCPHPLTGLSGTCNASLAGTSGYPTGEVEPDTTAPVMSSPSPTGEQTCGTDPTDVEISVTTDESATCKYNATDVAYASMSGTFTGSGTSHTATVSSACDSTQTYYARCTDASSNVNTTSAVITYTMADTTDTTTPTMGSAALASDGRTLTLTASEAVQIGTGGNGGLAISLSGVTASYVSIVGTTITYYLSRVVYSTEELTWTYTQPANGIEDLAGNDLATVGSAQAITNNSTQVESTGSGGELFSNYAVTGTGATGNPLELGVRVTSTSAVKITEVCFYKSVTNTGTHVVNVWSASGSNLATKEVSGENESGWQCQALDSAVEVLPSTSFVVSYFSPTGVWNSVSNYFASPLVVSPFTADTGKYSYNASTMVPNQLSTRNYLVDFKSTDGYVVTPSLTGAGASISGSRVGLATEQPTVTVTLLDGWKVSSVAGTCGGSGSLDGNTYTYTPTALSADCTVAVTVGEIMLLN